MIKYLTQNLTEVKEGIIAHGVNCQGAMGSGVAKALRDKYPKIFDSYKELCTSGVALTKPDTLLGKVDYVLISEKPILFIANCFTQNFYGRTVGKKFATPDAIMHCLENILYYNAQGHYYPIYMPKIGCGLGGLDWETEVKPKVEWITNIYPNQLINICDLR